jgi:hypothetical protein
MVMFVPAPHATFPNASNHPTRETHARPTDTIREIIVRRRREVDYRSPMRAGLAVVATAMLVGAGCRGRGAAPAAASPDAGEGELPHSTMVARAMEELRIRTASFDNLFQIGEADWQLDQDAGEIVFTSPRGIVATASAQIAGTYNTDDSTWLWAWDNPSVEQKLAAHARVVRQYGNQRGIAELTTRKLVITEEKAWELAALTCKLGDNQGVYRGPAGATMVFITFGEVTMEKQAPARRRTKATPRRHARGK